MQKGKYVYFSFFLIILNKPTNGLAFNKNKVIALNIERKGRIFSNSIY
jgi:hypothetical protein